MKHIVFLLVALLIALPGCKKESTTGPNDTAQNVKYRVQVSFYSEAVSSTFFNYCSGFMCGVTSNWNTTSNQSFTLDLKMNEAKSVSNPSATITLRSSDSSHVSIAWQPHSLIAICDTKGTRRFSPDWYSKSMSSSAGYSYYSVGTVKEYISAAVTVIH